MASRSNRLELTLSDEQWDRLVRACGGLVKNATYAKAALDERLARDLDGKPVVSVPREQQPARRKPSVRETWAR